MNRDFRFHKIVEGNFLSHFHEKAHIYFKHYIPKDLENNKPAKYHVIFQHGMIEYHMRHEEFFFDLAEKLKQDVIISTMDLLGHGFSGGPRAYVDNIKTYAADLEQFFHICHKQFYQFTAPKTILVSHSLGGLVSIKAVTDPEFQLPFPIDAMIFSNPCIKPKIDLIKPVENFLNYIPEELARIHIPVVYSAYDLSQDPDKAISFMHDHLISKSISIKLGVEVVNAVKNINSLSYFFKIPSLFLLSGDDRIVDNEKTQLFITGMDKKLVKVKYYPNMRHDLLNETCRNDVFQEIITYIKAVGTTHV